MTEETRFRMSNASVLFWD